MSFFSLVKRLGRRLRAQGGRAILFYLAGLVTMGALIIYLTFAYYLPDDPRLIPDAFRLARRPLLITAHPDDESLFFSPSILYHRHDPLVTRSLLVLSSGNYDGIGEQRKTEVLNSCAMLSISPDHCVVLDHPELQDNPKKMWDEKLIEVIVAPYLKKWKIDLVMTFDQGGISGHINHRAVSAGVAKYVKTYEHAPPTFTLQSTSLLRKYSSLIDLLFSSLPFLWRILTTPSSPTTSLNDMELIGGDTTRERIILVSSWRTYLESRTAFSQHQSQYSWDRSLYLIMSRYMWFNTLERIR